MAHDRTRAAPPTPVRRVLADHRISVDEARALIARMRAGKLTPQDREALQHAMNVWADCFPDKAQQLLTALKLKNDPAALRANVNRSLKDGELDGWESPGLLRNLRKNGLTAPERAQLAELFARHHTRIAPDAERQLEQALSGRDLTKSTRPKTLQVNGIALETYGVRQPAIDEATRIIEAETKRPDIAQRLRDKKTVVVIIPRNKRMVDLPEFADLKGKRTVDGRLYDNIRGTGGNPLPDGRIAVAIPEEDLEEKSRRSFNIPVHELAHHIQNVGVTDQERAQIHDAYTARKAAGGPWVDTERTGAPENELEYWAESTQAYFGRLGDKGPKWLARHDPALFGLMRQVYGDPPKAWVS